MPRTEPSTFGRRRSTRMACAVAACFAILAFATSTASGDDVSARVQAGVRLFRSLLAADLGLERRVDAEGRLVVLVFYDTDAERADRVAQQITTPAEGQAVDTIRDLPVVAERISDPSLSAYEQRAPAAIFVAEPPKDEVLRRIVWYGIDHGVVVFSPYAGHVEKGVLGGISVEAKVQPYLNQATLDASRVSLKPFFLKVSKTTR